MNPRMINGKFWLVWTLCLTGLGFFIGVVALIAAGAGMGGSGCGRECIDQATTIAMVGVAVLTGAIAAAVLSIITSWTCQKPKSGIWVRSLITMIDVFALSVSSAGAAFLWGF